MFRDSFERRKGGGEAEAARLIRREAAGRPEGRPPGGGDVPPFVYSMSQAGG